MATHPPVVRGHNGIGADITSYLLIGGVVFFAGLITLLDWLGRRKHRRSEHRPAR